MEAIKRRKRRCLTKENRIFSLRKTEATEMLGKVNGDLGIVKRVLVEKRIYYQSLTVKEKKKYPFFPLIVWKEITLNLWA
jgi:hypothetical protein